MSRADHAYHTRKADEEQAQADRTDMIEAKAAHRQLRDLYLTRTGVWVGGVDLTEYANEHA